MYVLHNNLPTMYYHLFSCTGTTESVCVHGKVGQPRQDGGGQLTHMA